jgi:hypothetical protein
MATKRRRGNLYAMDQDTSYSAVARYNANDLKPGAKPSIVDKYGLPGAFSPVDFSLSSDGDLYVTNCSGYSGVIVFPTSRKPFSSALAPSVIYRNSVIQTNACVWGIAIK